MSTLDINPYEVLGIPQNATSKEITLAQSRAIHTGSYDRATVLSAMQMLTDVDRRMEIDVLRISEASFDFVNDLPSPDTQQVLAALSEDAPILRASLMVPWEALRAVPTQLEACPFDLSPPQIPRMTVDADELFPPLTA